MKKWPDGLPRAANSKFKKVEPRSSWFEIYIVNAETYAILEPDHDEEVLSYLLLGEAKAVLIDTGMGIDNIKAEVDNLTDLPVMVINTHTHFDHTGDNWRFSELCCFNDEWELKNTEMGHANDFCKNFMEPHSYRNLPAGFAAASYHIKPSTITRRLNHLDSIDLGNRTLIIHHTPGHSPGSLCIEDKKYQLLFTGDTYYPGKIVADLPGSSQIDFFNSVKYLAGITEQLSYICPSHNELFAQRDALRALHEACEAVKAGQAEYEMDNQSKLYKFTGFTLRLPS